jgi:hypothetical protein
MADRRYSPQQDGSQDQHLCPLRLEGNRVVWRCSCHKEGGMSPGSRKPLSRPLQLVVIRVWITWHTQHTQLYVHATLFLRVRTLSAAGRLPVLHRIASHTLTLLCSCHFTRNSVSVFIRMRCMDDKISWLGGWTSQWRPPQARCMHYRIVRQFGRRRGLALRLNGVIFQFLGSIIF